MRDRSDRRPSGRRGRRPGFTLLEVTLALAIGVLLLVGLYGAIRVQIRHSQGGRDLVEQNTLARSILNRIGNDVSATVALSDPARFRLANSSSGGGSGGSAGSGGSGGAGASGSTPSSTTPSAGTGSAAGGTSSTDPSSSSGTGTTTAQDAVTLPLGVQGDANQLTLIISKVPGEAYGSKPGDAGQLTSDLRQVTYWLAAGGLARQELQVVTSLDAVNQTVPSGDAEARLVIAPEVRSLTFGYFDGTSWQDSWDSTTLGPDGLTPQGSPRAISVTIGIAYPGRRGQEEVRTYRHVVAIATANGTTLLQNNGTNQSNGNSQTNGGGTSP
jgi:prepilin-type N-terminal cleavage/methylation domain-containing protein